MLRVALTFAILFPAYSCFATHNRAGEISFTHLSGLTYEITVTMWTKASSVAADRCELVVSYGDLSTDTLPRVNGPAGDCDHMGELVLTVPDLKKSYYVTTHTYPGPGSYTISVSDPNRDGNLLNMPNSVNTTFYIESELIINPFTGNNNSVWLAAEPITLASMGQPYIHNVTAIDPDGDNLLFELVACRGDNGASIPGYTIPAGATINALNGEISWPNPPSQGAYALAVLVEEYRDGALIGSVIRDFQVTFVAQQVEQSFGQPVLLPTDVQGAVAFSVQPTDTIGFDLVWLHDTGEMLPVVAYSELYQLSNPPSLDTVIAVDSVNMSFEWIPDTAKIRPHPYIFVIRGNYEGIAQDFTALFYVGYPVPTGAIEQQEQLSSVRVFPNPGSETISLAVDWSGPSHWQVFGVNGQLMWQATTAATVQKLSVADFETGLYLYRVQAADGRVESGRFAVAH